MQPQASPLCRLPHYIHTLPPPEPLLLLLHQLHQAAVLLGGQLRCLLGSRLHASQTEQQSWQAREHLAQRGNVAPTSEVQAADKCTASSSHTWLVRGDAVRLLCPLPPPRSHSSQPPPPDWLAAASWAARRFSRCTLAWASRLQAWWASHSS